jgi:hypothetical protein
MRRFAASPTGLLHGNSGIAIDSSPHSSLRCGEGRDVLHQTEMVKPYVLERLTIGLRIRFELGIGDWLGLYSASALYNRTEGDTPR